MSKDHTHKNRFSKFLSRPRSFLEDSTSYRGKIIGQPVEVVCEYILCQNEPKHAVHASTACYDRNEFLLIS